MEKSNQSVPHIQGGDQTPAPQQEEYYPEPLTGDLAIGIKWVIWEQYEEPPGLGSKKDPTKEEFNKLMTKLGWFHDYITFWQLWQMLPITKLENYFYDKANNQMPLFSVTKEGETTMKRISSLSFFQSGIKPQWEDPVNTLGSELQCMLPNGLTYSRYNRIWEDIITDLVTKKIPHVEDVAGVRIFDKTRTGELVIRLDIWLKIADENGDKTKAIKAYLAQNLFEKNEF